MCDGLERKPIAANRSRQAGVVKDSRSDRYDQTIGSFTILPQADQNSQVIHTAYGPQFLDDFRCRPPEVIVKATLPAFMRLDFIHPIVLSNSYPSHRYGGFGQFLQIKTNR